MVVPLHHDQRIAGHVLGSDKPRIGVAVFLPADTEALPLPQRVIHQALMLTNDSALGRFHVTWVAWQVAFEKFAEVALADEADAGAVFFGGVGQADSCGDCAHLGFRQMRQRKQRRLYLGLAQAVEEIALVLVAVRCAQQGGRPAASTPLPT